MTHEQQNDQPVMPHGFFTSPCIITGRNRVKKFEHATSRYGHYDRIMDGAVANPQGALRTLLRGDPDCIAIYNPDPSILEVIITVCQTGHAVMVSMPGTYEEAVAAFDAALGYPHETPTFDVPDGFLHDSTLHTDKPSARDRMGQSGLLKAARRLYQHNLRAQGITDAPTWGKLDPASRERLMAVVPQVVEAIWDADADDDEAAFEAGAYVLIQTRKNADGQMHWSTASLEERAAAAKTARSVYDAAFS